MNIEDKIMHYFITGITYIMGAMLGVSGILCIVGIIKTKPGLLEDIIGIFAGIGFIGISFISLNRKDERIIYEKIACFYINSGVCDKN